MPIDTFRLGGINSRRGLIISSIFVYSSGYSYLFTKGSKSAAKIHLSRKFTFGINKSIPGIRSRDYGDKILINFSETELNQRELELFKKFNPSSCGHIKI